MNSCSRVLLLAMLILFLASCKKDKAEPRSQLCQATGNVSTLELPDLTSSLDKSVAVLENGKVIFSTSSNYYIYSNNLNLEKTTAASGGKSLFSLGNEFVSFDETVFSTPFNSPLPSSISAFVEISPSPCDQQYTFTNHIDTSGFTKDSTFTQLYFHDNNAEIVNSTTLEGILFDVKKQGRGYIFLSVEYPGWYPRPIYDGLGVFQDTLKYGFSELTIVLSKYSGNGNLLWQTKTHNTWGLSYFESYHDKSLSYSLAVTNSYIWVLSSSSKMLYQFTKSGSLKDEKTPFLSCDETDIQLMGGYNNTLYLNSFSIEYFTYTIPDHGNHGQFDLRLLNELRNGVLLGDNLYYYTGSLVKYSLTGQELYSKQYNTDQYTENSFVGIDCNKNIFILNQTYTPQRKSYIHKVNTDGELPPTL